MDGDGDAPLVFSWNLAVRPEGSLAFLEGADQQCVSFFPDALGWYALEVDAFDGIVCSVIDAVEVEIIMPPPPPSGGGDGCGCAFTGGANQGGLASLIILLPVWFILRRLKIRT